MGATGRKLTIRMPDNPGLRSAEVGKVHLDPGARVQSGNPVLTLLNRRKEHLVRAPRPGRIVPLIAPGDRVSGGDPLYILHIDEAALEEQIREDRAMIAVEREKWTSGVLADAIEPIRRQKAENEPSQVPAFVANWGKPVLALALYVLACFALLPILHFFGKTASLPVLIAMVAGCIAFAVLIFYLYAPDSGRWPRWTVRMVAISWVGISSAALFYRPDNPNDINLDNAIGPIAGLFEPAEKPLAPAPEAAPAPIAIVQSGVAIGSIEANPSPKRSEPVSVLASFDEVIIPHGVRVRPWGRVNPGTSSGEEPLFDQQDRGISAPVASSPVLLASVIETEPREGAPVLPAGLLDTPKRAERQADVVMAAIPQVQDTGLPPLASSDVDYRRDASMLSVAALVVREPEAGSAQDSDAGLLADAQTLVYGDARTMTAETLPILRGEQVGQDVDATTLAAISGFDTRFSETAGRGLISSQPDQARTPAINLVSVLRSGDANWAEDQLAVLGSDLASSIDGARLPDEEPSVARYASTPSGDAALAPRSDQDLPAPPLAEGQIALGIASPAAPKATSSFALALDARSASTTPTGAPTRVAASRSPGLLLISAVRAGEAGWMLDQTQILAADVGEDRAAGFEPFTRTQSPVNLTNLNAGQIAGAPRVAALSDRIGIAKDFGMAVLPVLDGEPSAPSMGEDERAEVQIARLTPLSAFDAPSIIGDAFVPDRAPQAPPLQPEITLAQRDLLYLYFDDPRILSHPQLGDPWEGLVSPALAAAIERTEVVEVHEMLQVQNWCGAANDPDGTKRAELGPEYTTAFINDRIRLLRVRLSVDDSQLALLESEVPLFDGTPAGFFHNKAPLLGGQPEDALMQRGRDYLRSLSAGIFDPNAPDAIGGGQYFDNAVAVSVILRGAGCDQASLNEGAGAANDIGRILESRLGG